MFAKPLVKVCHNVGQVKVTFSSDFVAFLVL